MTLHGQIVRRLRLGPGHLPVPIFTFSTEEGAPRPIEPDWACILHRSDRHVPPTFEQYELAFYRDDGTWLEGITCETLEIAVDQASELIGVRPDEWEEVRRPEPHLRGESRLSDWAPPDAFPRGLHADATAPAFISAIPPSDLLVVEQFTVRVEDDEIHIPYRLYNEFPEAAVVAALPPRQQRMIDCLYTRHHNGHVREACVERIIESREPWTVPFVVRLLGEYVLEIVELIADRVPQVPAIPMNYRAFSTDNEDFLARTTARATSYWNCYHRRQYPEPEAYPALRLLSTLRSEARE